MARGGHGGGAEGGVPGRARAGGPQPVAGAVAAAPRLAAGGGGGALPDGAALGRLVPDGLTAVRAHRLGGTGQAPDLPLVGLPAYSPELNPAERVFQEPRRAVEGRVYATLDAKVAAVEAELAKLDADPARVRSLANWHWIDQAVEHLPAAHVA